MKERHQTRCFNLNLICNKHNALTTTTTTTTTHIVKWKQKVWIWFGMLRIKRETTLTLLVTNDIYLCLLIGDKFKCAQIGQTKVKWTNGNQIEPQLYLSLNRLSEKYERMKIWNQKPHQINVKALFALNLRQEYKETNGTPAKSFIMTHILMRIHACVNKNFICETGLIFDDFSHWLESLKNGGWRDRREKEREVERRMAVDGVVVGWCVVVFQFLFTVSILSSYRLPKQNLPVIIVIVAKRSIEWKICCAWIDCT